MPAETLPDSIGPYKVVGLLGKGGMGAVYKAFKPPLVQRYVAVKTIKAEFLATPDALRRFRREAELSSQLKHPNIVAVYDYEEVQHGDSYIVNELIEGGKTLRDRMQEGHLGLDEISSIIAQLSSALDYAYETYNIVHRDIKPGNVFIEGKRVALGDFGIAKDVSRNTQLTNLGEGVGTPDYMSPEQAMGEQLDHRSDIYSLGVMLFEMLTGSLPFRGDTPISVVMGHIQKPIPVPRSLNPDIPPSVEAVVMRSLQKKRDNRFASAGEMSKALDAAVKGATGGQTFVPAPPPPPKPEDLDGSGPIVTRELDVVTLLEGQGKFQEAFNRLNTLKMQYPKAESIITRYESYVKQGYTPTGNTGSVGLTSQPTQYPTPGQSTPFPQTGQQTPFPSGSVTVLPGGGTTTVQPTGKKLPLPAIIGGVAVVLVITGIVLAVVFSGGGGKGTATATTVAAVTVTTSSTTGTGTTTAGATTAPVTTGPNDSERAKLVNAEGEALLNRGNTLAAIEKFKEAVRLSSGTAVYHGNLARAYLETQDYSLSENEARLAVSLDPNVASYQNTLGMALSSQNKKSSAESPLREAVRIKPEVPIYHANLADVLIDLNKLPEAESEARRAITLFKGIDNPPADQGKNVAYTQNILGMALELQAKYTDSETAYRDALKLVPTSAVYQLGISRAILDQGRDALNKNQTDAANKLFTSAESEARKAVSLDTNLADANEQLGLCLEFQNKYGDAANSYQKAIDVGKKEPAYKQARYMRNLAGVLIELGKYAEAETQALNSVQLDGTVARGFNLLGNAQYDQQKFDTAVVNYQKAIDLSRNASGSDIYYDNLGRAYESLKQYPKARDAYQKALELNPNNKNAQADLDRVKTKITGG